jgi:rubredoxin
VCVETMHDLAPGPRFYCRGCAIAYLQEQGEEVKQNAQGNQDHNRQGG